MSLTDANCPIPLDHTHVTLGHGGGGRLSQQLLARLLLPRLTNPLLAAATDAAVVPSDGATRFAFTTDSYVVKPIFFPGGDIGKLAVCGTVNDLATAGAIPKQLSLSLILEEGLAFADLERVIDSVARAARECDVQIVTGDTKVVERGRCEQLYVNTAGIGWVQHDQQLQPSALRQGDQLILSGDLGRHGAAVMSLRAGIELHTHISSDVAPIHRQVLALLDAKLELRCLRDLTRGGLASALHELASSAGYTFGIQESAIAITPEVRAVCELLGLDPLSLANEGRFLVAAAPEQANACVTTLREHGCPDATIIGEVLAHDPAARVWTQTAFGVKRVLHPPSGELLPRIC